MNIYCKDGLSALDVYNIEHIYHFGSGNLTFKDCGAANEWVALNQAYQDMYHAWQTSPMLSNDPKSPIKDYHLAYEANAANIVKFAKTDVYKNWITTGDEHEL